MSDVIKINNPLYVANLVPLIQDFLDKTTLPNVNIHSMVAFFQRTAQLGGEIAELWAAFENNEPIGFAHWSVRDLPLIGSVHLRFMYCKGNRKDLVKQLVLEFEKFGVKHNSPWYMYDVVNHPKLINHFANIAQEFAGEQIWPIGPCRACKRQYSESDRDKGPSHDTLLASREAGRTTSGASSASSTQSDAACCDFKSE